MAVPIPQGPVKVDRRHGKTPTESCGHCILDLQLALVVRKTFNCWQNCCRHGRCWQDRKCTDWGLQITTNGGFSESELLDSIQIVIRVYRNDDLGIPQLDLRVTFAFCH